MLELSKVQIHVSLENYIPVVFMITSAMLTPVLGQDEVQEADSMLPVFKMR